MAINVFLKIPGIEGESQNENHKNEIEITSYSFSGHHTGSPESGTGLAGGKAQVTDLQLTKVMDKSSPKILEACCIGKPIPGGPVILSVDRAGDPPVTYLKVTLHNAVISSYHVSSAGGDLPNESLTISSLKIEQEYKPIDEKGNPQGAIKAHYDLKKAEGE